MVLTSGSVRDCTGSPLTLKTRTSLPVTVYCAIAWHRRERWFRLHLTGDPTLTSLSLQSELQNRRETTEERRQRFQQLLDSGEANSRADLARKLGCSRAWVTKVLGSSR